MKHFLTFILTSGGKNLTVLLSCGHSFSTDYFLCVLCRSILCLYELVSSYMLKLSGSFILVKLNPGTIMEF